MLTVGLPDAPAILGAGRPALTHGALATHIRATARLLRGCGIRRGQRVAICLPNGPELATAFLAVASFTTAAPLNPALSRQEVEYGLQDLDVRAVLLAEGEPGAVRDAATALGIPVIDLRPEAEGPAGLFSLPTLGPATGDDGGPGDGDEPDCVALVLQTSGTTAKPKTVPLEQRHLMASARHVRETLRLTSDDRCLNVMPLFHIHGLVACLLAPLSAGGSVYCAAGFNPLRFFAELEDSAATWYSAVPTIHQAVLSRAARNADRVAAARLRFIRSSSSALPPTVLHDLEATFGVPVVEAYGMTEAAHQMACNPLPPGERRPGSVGLAAGPEVAIMDGEGRLLGPGAIGEVVVRGPNLFRGYERRPEANATAFTDGWFRTGDQGRMDADGYLTLTSRLKELINRGGEKISPREIDEVLLEHEAVRQAVAFAIPHPVLGEAVGAAVALKEGAEVTERELLAFVATRLAPFKVPATLRIVDELPRGATGKIQRLTMASQLGLA